MEQSLQQLLQVVGTFTHLPIQVQRGLCGQMQAIDRGARFHQVVMEQNLQLASQVAISIHLPIQVLPGQSRQVRAQGIGGT
jgi:hypothetical protein